MYLLIYMLYVFIRRWISLNISLNTSLPFSLLVFSPQTFILLPLLLSSQCSYIHAFLFLIHFHIINIVEKRRQVLFLRAKRTLLTCSSQPGCCHHKRLAARPSHRRLSSFPPSNTISHLLWFVKVFRPSGHIQFHIYSHIKKNDFSCMARPILAFSATGS